jgi:hypothetical protein
MIDNAFSDSDTIESSMRAALLLELAHETIAKDGSRLTYARLVARKLIDLAVAGDLRAIKEINDRVDGRPHNGKRVQRPGTMVDKRDDGGSSGGGVDGGNTSPQDEGGPGTASGPTNDASPERSDPCRSSLPPSRSPERRNDRSWPNEANDRFWPNEANGEMSIVHSYLAEDAGTLDQLARSEPPQEAGARRHFGRTNPMRSQAYCVPAMPAWCTTLPQRRISELMKSRSPPIEGLRTGSMPVRAI